VNPGLPVIGLPEGDWLRVSGSLIELRGPHPAVWFRLSR
jgi:dipeptidase E